MSDVTFRTLIACAHESWALTLAQIRSLPEVTR